MRINFSFYFIDIWVHHGTDCVLFGSHRVEGVEFVVFLIDPEEFQLLVQVILLALDEFLVLLVLLYLQLLLFPLNYTFDVRFTLVLG